MRTSTEQTSPPHAAFAARLRSTRLRSGKSQAQIAAEVGTSRRNWIRWENGDHLPSRKFVARIAEATGKSAEFFDGDKPAPAAPDGLDDEESDRVADMMAALIRRLVRDEVRSLA